MTAFMEGLDLPDVSGVEVPEGYQPITSSSPFGGLNGPVFERLDEEGQLWRGFRVDRRHINMGGRLHGGMLMTLADIILGQVAWTTLEGPCVTVRLSSEFMGGAKLGDWVAGTAKAMGQEQGFIHMHVTIYGSDQPIFMANGTFKAIAVQRK